MVSNMFNISNKATRSAYIFLFVQGTEYVNNDSHGIYACTFHIHVVLHKIMRRACRVRGPVF